MVPRRCSAKKSSKKFHKIHREIPMLQCLSRTAKYLLAARLSTLLKRNPRTGVTETVLNDSQNSEVSIYIGVSFLIKFTVDIHIGPSK